MGKLSRDALIFTAQHFPDKFFQLMEDESVDSVDLCLLVDIAGSLFPYEKCGPYLLKFLLHESPLTREFSVYGLGYHLNVAIVVSALTVVAEEDPTPSVRQVAKFILSQKK